MSETITNQLSWVIGAPQGSGVDTAANIFAKACALGGLSIFGKREYYSNIKGEHSYFTVRISEKPIRSHVDESDLLAAFDAETILRHALNVVNGGAIIYDTSLLETSIDEIPTLEDGVRQDLKSRLEARNLESTVKGMLELAQNNGVVLVGISFHDLLKEVAEKRNEPSLSKLIRMFNVMALASSFALLDYDPKLLAGAIRYIFKARPKVAEMNVDAANYTYNHTKAKYGENFRYKLLARKVDDDVILVQGHQAAALGKMVGGCRFQTYYPITPASDESEYLESNEVPEDDGKNSVVVVQTEDEIAAIAMAIGGGVSGARSATSTSGPGFSLMAEALGWAGMNEVPVVVTLYQRGGPSTGLPTRHEQGDLLFAIHAGHGDFPRIVLASGDIEESFYDAANALNYAERYQMPVIHLVDKALASSVVTIKTFDPSRVKIDRGNLLESVGEGDSYLRFKFTENGISPRVKLGTPNGIFWNTGDEHTEDGHISEDPENRNRMMAKRMGKLQLALEEIPEEEKALRYGDEESDMTIISWGSTKGAILDAMDRIRGEGVKINFVQLKLLNPFPDSYVASLLKKTRLLIDVEMNYSAQLARLIRENLKRDPDYYVVKYNGRPMSSSEVYRTLRKIVDGKAKSREVLTHGA
ncbi:MAG: 2-oxoacid:ferredoxin oxidoreductase subunit alpha [Nitrososphaerales archaeon]